MIKHFYSYHVEIESVIVEINSLPIRDHEKKHLIELAQSQIHNAIIDTILSELDRGDAKKFLEHLNTKNHDKIWKFLRARIQDVENKIQKRASEIKRELSKEIREVKGG